MFTALRRVLAVFVSFTVLLSSLQPIRIQAQTTAEPIEQTPLTFTKFLVDTTAKTAHSELAAQGGVPLVDYGSFALWQAPVSVVPTLASQPGVEWRMDFDEIALRGQPLNTRTGAGPAVPQALRQTRTEAPQLWLVQFVGPIKDEWLAEMQALNVQIVTYMANNAYVIWGDGDSLTALEKLASVSPVIQWTGPYHPAYRVAPSVLTQATAEKNETVLEISVQFYITPALNDSLAALIDLGGEPISGLERIASFAALKVRLPAYKIAEAAHWPDVFNIGPYVRPEKLDEIQNQIMAGNITTISGTVVPSAPGYLAWLASKNFPTNPLQYPVVDIVDDGLDQGNAAQVLHPDFHELGQSANPDRVLYITNCTVIDNIGNAVGGHGNLNAGIVGAYNNLSGSPHVDAEGYRLGLGVSPYGRLAATKIFANLGFYDVSACGNTDTGVVFASYSGGADFTSNSWGAGVGGAYEDSAQAYDALTRDAASSVPGLQPMLHIFAAGNDGSSANTMSTPGTAKNVLTVGATENVRDNGVNDGCGETNANNADDMAVFSSRGPTDDGRVKPDLVAPGTHVQGPASQDPGFNALGVCGAFGNNSFQQPQDYYPAGQTLYTWSTGTSHSTPAVAGAASLAWEYYNRVLVAGEIPSPAMLKALLINSARPIAGSGAGVTIPNNNQGWGDVDLGRLTDDVPRRLIDQTQVFANTGEELIYSGSISNDGQPFRVTLVWTDPPGPTSGNAYVNNLDLEVTVNGTPYKGNVFSGTTSTAGGSFDPRNNVEGVYLPAGVTGTYVVRVMATNIAGDGLPDNADATDQDFALVIYNGTSGNSALSGLVTSGATPIVGAVVRAVTGTVLVASTSSDATGTYSTTLPADTYTVSAWAYGYAQQNIANVTTLSGTTTLQDFNLVAQPNFTVSGALSDQVTGSPVTGTVKVFGPLGDLLTQTVSAAPIYNFSLPGTGGTFSYTLQAEAPLYHTVQIPLNLTSTTTQNLTLLYTLTGLSGTVRSQNTNQPLSSASVALTGPSTANTSTNSLGQYQFTNLISGTYTATVSASSYTPLVTNVTVISNTISARDFAVASSQISVVPAQLQQSILFGTVVTQTSAFAINSTGTAPLTATIAEGYTTPLGSGPDAYGYRWLTGTYVFTDISSSGTALNLIDDSEGNITLPFSFPFYGGSSTDLRIGNNGGILFDATTGDVGFSNTALSSAPNNLIAPFWDDVDSDTGNVYWQVLGSAPNRYAIVQWHNRPHFSNIGSGTFQAVLYEDGNLLFQYQDVDFGNATYNFGASATIGIRGNNAAEITQRSANSAVLSNGQTICFSRPGNAVCGEMVPWLSPDIIRVTNLTGTQAVSVTYDATEVPLPGVYTATLFIAHNAPQPQVKVPVTMTVTPPASYGVLQGAVGGLGRCDQAGSPLSGASVVVQGSNTYTFTTNASGAFSTFLPGSAGTPYTLTISASGYITQTSFVNVTQAQTTTANFNLRLNASCLNFSPNQLTSTQAENTLMTQTVTISNTGAAPLTWAMEAQNFTPLARLDGETARLASSARLAEPPPVRNSPALEVIQDGSFETTSPVNGTNAYWQQSSTNYGVVLCNASCGTGGGTTGPRTGAFWAWFGGISPAAPSETAIMTQTVVITPGSAATLNFWLRIGSTSNRDSDYFQVTLDGTEVFSVTAAASSPYVSYQQISIDVTAFATGTPRVLSFRAFVPTGGNTNYSLDDVSLGMADCAVNAIPWLAISPISGTVAPSGSAVLTATLNSDGLLPGVYRGRLCLISDVSAATFNSIPVTMTIPGYNVSLKAPMTARASGAGSVITYTVYVTNSGTIPDTFNLILAGQAFTTTAPASVGPLAPGTGASIPIAVSIPTTATLGAMDMITVTAQSQGNVARTASLMLTTTVAANVYGFNLSVTPPTSGASPGQMVTYTVMLNNTANVPDSFNVSLSGNTFSAMAPTAVGPVGNGASATFTISVTVPITATIGTVDGVTATVTSQGDGAQVAAVSAQTTANSYRLHLPIIGK